MSTVSRRVESALPETGTREWWLLYLLAPIVLVGTAIIAFPTLVYDQFIWQYLWGPVVADAAGQPATHEGIRAVSGYNAMNTVTYLAAVVYSIPGLRAYLDHLDVTFDARLAYGFAPLIVAGGAMRALEDVGVLGDYAVLFITPSIYFVVTAVTVLALGVGALARNRGFASIPQTVGAVGSIWAIGTVGWRSGTARRVRHCFDCGCQSRRLESPLV
ncbi:DUF63 family protein [Haladaptatus sp. NG-WS-4]